MIRDPSTWVSVVRRPYVLGEDGYPGARWQLVRSFRDEHGYLRSSRVLEDDVPTSRALALARLLGIEDTIAKTLRAEAEELSQSAAARLERTREQRAEAELRAVEERREADRLRREIKRLEVATDAA